MKTLKKLLKISFAASFLVFLTLMTGCNGKEDRLFNHIPADSETVAAINLDMLMKNAGCKTDNGAVTLTPDIELLKAKIPQKSADIISYMVLAAPAINLEQIIYLADEKVYIVSLKSPEIFKEAIRLGAASTEEDGDAEFFIFDDVVIAVENSTAWATGKDPDNIKKVMASAAKKGFAETYPELAGELENTENAATFVSRIAGKTEAKEYNGAPQHFDNLYAVGQLSVTDSYMTLTARLTDSRLKPMEFEPYFAETGTEFLRFVEPQSSIVAAIGKPSELRTVIAAITNIANINAGDVRLMLPYLESIEGTTGISLIPIADPAALKTFEPGTWDITISSVLHQEDARNILSLLKLSGARELEEGPAGGEETQYFLKYNGYDIYTGLFEGTSVLSTHPVSGTCSNAYTADFQGARAGLVISCAPGSKLAKLMDIPYGIYLSAILGDNDLTCRFKFNGSPRNVLGTLINLIATTSPDYSQESLISATEEITPDIVTE